jgi:hypothetical protein
MEIVIVVVIVALTAFLLGRSCYRSLKGKNDRCGCGGLQGCSPKGCTEIQRNRETE